MWESFSNDKSTFKRNIFLVFTVSIIALISSFLIIEQYITKANENNKLEATLAAQNQWLDKFNYREATLINKSILKPCAQNEIERVQVDQLNILKKHNLEIVSTKNNPTPTNFKLMKAVKSSIEAKGSWQNITAALNEFENNNLVVIVRAVFTMESNNVVIKLDYNTYYK